MKFLREPLVHFLALGAALFVLFAIVGESDEEAERVVVTASQIESLADEFVSTWQRRPTADELDDLIEQLVRDEIAYREALAMGLERDDAIIRQRLQQKLEFLTDDMAAATEPSEEELREHFVEHIDTFRPSPRLSFDQVFFNREMRGETALQNATQLLSQLAESKDEVDPETLGDPLTVPSAYERTTLERISRRFGPEFAERVAAAPVGSWSGPVESGFGLHLVRVREFEVGADPQFEDVRDEVERAWRAARESEAAEAFFEGIRDRYVVEIEKTDTAAE